MEGEAFLSCGEGFLFWRKPSERVGISRVLYSLRSDDHLSGRIVTDRLKQPTRISCWHGPHQVLADGILLGLAPDEVYRAVPVTRNAVSSYLAISPLPCPDLRPNLAVCFLLHCLSRFRAWTLSSILPCGARTFLQLSPAAIRYPQANLETFAAAGKCGHVWGLRGAVLHCVARDCWRIGKMQVKCGQIGKMQVKCGQIGFRGGCFCEKLQTKCGGIVV